MPNNQRADNATTIGFIEGVLLGIKSSPREFRMEAVDEALEKLAGLKLQPVASPQTDPQAR